jgi:capsular polysaccharide biosynthesis protein
MYDGDHLFELLGTDDYTYVDDRAADRGTGVTNLAFIKAVLRRRVRFWCTFAVVGMLLGIGFTLKGHPTYQASTSLLLTPQASPGEASGAPILNEQSIAQSRAVAGLALAKLGLPESISSFQTTYTVTAPTDRVLVITVSAPSSSEAVSRASALATAFLGFRTNLVDAAQNLVVRTLQQQIKQAQQHVSSINAQIAQVSAEPTSDTQQADLKDLQTQANNATGALTTIEAANTQNQVSSQITSYGIVHDSKVLDPAGPLQPHSRLKLLIEHTLIGLIAGLAVGMGIVIIGALISDRLRQRDDVARALGAPVKLSVGTVRRGRRGRGGGGQAATQSTNIKRVAAYLDTAVPSSPRGPANLAVVPVDDVHVPAACLVALAVSCAQRGLRVVVADLCDDAPAARLLGASDPGVQTVSTQGTDLTVIVPDRDDVVPVGPLQPNTGRVRAAEPVVAACTSADLLLTLATLDPSLGGEHLAGWAHSAVATVTAGESTAARIRAVSEMIRLAEMSLISGVLIGADKTDVSLGVLSAPEGDGSAAAGSGWRSDAEATFVAADETSGRRASEDR